MKAYRGDGEPTRTDRATLDCPECGAWFEDFGTLAAHVQRAHPATPRAESAKQVTQHLQRTERAESTEPAMSTIPSAERSEQAERPDFNPFLKAENIGRGKIGATATLILTGVARVQRGMYGQQIIAEVKHGRDVFDWGIKINSPNHRLLEDAVGNDSAKWRGKKIDVEILENLGRAYIAIKDGDSVKSATKKAATKKRR